jgi:hypothetical protein
MQISSQKYPHILNRNKLHYFVVDNYTADEFFGLLFKLEYGIDSHRNIVMVAFKGLIYNIFEYWILVI